MINQYLSNLKNNFRRRQEFLFIYEDKVQEVQY